MAVSHPAIHEVIQKHADQLRELSIKIHENPELGLKEEKACAWQVELLKEWGFKVDIPFAGYETAYCAVRGEGKPVFCFMAEYDALPEIGHACGHNLICSAALGAGVSLAEALEKENIEGTVIVMGTPAEETKGGKAGIIKHDGLKNIDAVMMAHPSRRTIPDNGCTAIKSFHISYEGKAAHAAGAPEKGVNALDAVMLLFQGVNAWRQHLVETCRVHGIVTEGGAAANIIPEKASCVFCLRALEDNVLEDMVGRFKEIAEGAALMTGARLIMPPDREGYKARKPNKHLNSAYVKAAEAVGLNPEIPEKSGRGSSDFGNVSQEVPGAHVYFGISKESPAAHSVEFAEAAGSEYGLDQMIRAAEALALSGYRYFTDSSFRESVHEEFEKIKGKIS